jgi:pimeloyl-ACP methyl ester carboxylesterase
MTPVQQVQVVGADGVQLHADVTGTGPPLVLVHGTTGTRESWAAVAPLLAERHTVWAYDRRGRGGSTDATDHSLVAEAEDLLAVLAAAGPGAHLVGHSYGGAVALEAARLGPDLASLVLYEPPGHASRKQEVVRRAQALLAAGEVEEGLRVQLLEAAALSEAELSFLESVPVLWQRIVGTAPTVGREVQALLDQGWVPERYAGLGVPVLLLSGELTGSPVYLSADDLREAVPDARAEVLAGQRHLAFATGPQSFADAVLGFTATARPAPGAG